MNLDSCRFIRTVDPQSGWSGTNIRCGELNFEQTIDKFGMFIPHNGFHLDGATA